MTYVLGNLLLHSHDALVAGVAYHLATFTRYRAYGILLAILYGLALVAMALSVEPFDWWGPIAAAIGMPLAHIRGVWRTVLKQRRSSNRLR